MWASDIASLPSSFFYQKPDENVQSPLVSTQSSSLNDNWLSFSQDRMEPSYPGESTTPMQEYNFLGHFIATEMRWDTVDMRACPASTLNLLTRESVAAEIPETMSSNDMNTTSTSRYAEELVNMIASGHRVDPLDDDLNVGHALVKRATPSCKRGNKRKKVACMGKCGELECTSVFSSKANLSRHCLPKGRRHKACDKCATLVLSQNMARHKKGCLSQGSGRYGNEENEDFS